MAGRKPGLSCVDITTASSESAAWYRLAHAMEQSTNRLAFSSSMIQHIVVLKGIFLEWKLQPERAFMRSALFYSLRLAAWTTLFAILLVFLFTQFGLRASPTQLVLKGFGLDGILTPELLVLMLAIAVGVAFDKFVFLRFYSPIIGKRPISFINENKTFFSKITRLLSSSLEDELGDSAQLAIRPLLVARLRLLAHVRRLQLYATTNLVIAGLFSLVGVVVLYQTSSDVARNLDSSGIQSDISDIKLELFRSADFAFRPRSDLPLDVNKFIEETNKKLDVNLKEIRAKWLNEEKNQQLIVYVVATRIILSISIQIFSYFFLSMYRGNTADIKYFQNEMSNLDAKISSALLSEAGDDSSTKRVVIEKLLNDERNRLQTDDQRLVSSDNDTTVFSEVVSKAAHVVEVLKPPAEAVKAVAAKKRKSAALKQA
jgi:hypothetical protein